MSDTLLDIIGAPVDIKKLVSRLTFDLDDLEKAEHRQPRLRLEAGRFRAQIALKEKSVKRKLNRLIGKKSLRIRDLGEHKTEAAVKNVLSQDREVQKAQKKADTLEVYSDFAKDLMEAFKERSMALSNLTRLRSAEIGSHLASVKGEDEVDRIRKRAERMHHRLDDMDD